MNIATRQRTAYFELMARRDKKANPNKTSCDLEKSDFSWNYIKSQINKIEKERKYNV